MVLMHYRSAGYSHVGCLRDHNQDAYCVLDGAKFWAVSDGMGGESRGGIASSLLIKALEKVAEQDTSIERLSSIRSSIKDIHRYLRDDLTRLSVDESIGTTLVSLTMVLDRAECIWIGDSRLYLWRGPQLKALTRDHSRAQNLVQKGLLTLEAARRHPSRHCLMQAIGMDNEIQCEKISFPVQPGDRLLLCTDGLYQSISLETMFRLLKQEALPDVARALVGAALKANGSDDITAVVVEVGV